MPSSSFRSLLEPLAENGEDLRARSLVDEDDEAEAELLLVALVQTPEGGEERGVVVGALLLGGALRPAALTDPRMRVQRLDLRVLREAREDGARLAERVLALRELLRQAGVALEQLRRAPRRSTAAVGRARVGGEEKRNVEVRRVVERHLELDPS